MFEQEHYFGRKKNAMTVNIQHAQNLKANQLDLHTNLKAAATAATEAAVTLGLRAPIWDGLGLYGKKAGHNYFVAAGAKRQTEPSNRSKLSSNLIRRQTNFKYI